MFWAFGIVVVLVAIILIPNVIEALRRYSRDRNPLLLSLSLMFLAVLSFQFLHLTKRTAEVVQSAKDVYADVEP